MKIWKSLLATILVLAALLTFVACDSGSKKKRNNDDDDDDDKTEESSNASGVTSGEASGEESEKETSKEESKKEESKKEESDSLEGTVWEGKIDMNEMVMSGLASNEKVLELLDGFDEKLYATIYFEFDEDTVEAGYRDVDQFEEDVEDYLKKLIKCMYDNGEVEDMEFDEFYEYAREEFFPADFTSGMRSSESTDYTYEDGELTIDGDEVEIKGNKIEYSGITLKKK